MTTAHRPTWAPAKGGEEQGGMRFYAPSQMRSVKDAAGFTKMKYRQDGQASVEELRRKDLKAELEAKEREHLLKSSKEDFLAEKERDLELLEAGVHEGGGGAPVLVPKAIDADVDVGESDESDDDDDDDDEAELLAELARIKQGREEEAARKAAEEAAMEEQAERAEMMRGNPLLQDKLAAASNGDGGSFAIKRRWDDDVVFKNQARNEPKQQRRFINDTLRSDFHRRFLERYIK